jgi:hypothetical protein
LWFEIGLKRFRPVQGLLQGAFQLFVGEWLGDARPWAWQVRDF